MKLFNNFKKLFNKFKKLFNKFNKLFNKFDKLFNKFNKSRETEVRLDGWCEGGVRQQRNDGGGCATMRERPKSVESPGTYVTK